MATEASSSSLKLCGSIFDESPTPIPSVPWARSSGKRTGSSVGSWLRPSYEVIQLVTLGSKSTSFANFDSLASIYRGAALESPVSMLPQFPWQSTTKPFCPSWTSAPRIDASPCGWYCIACPTMLATLVYFPSSILNIVCRTLRCTGLSPSTICGTARCRITYDA